MQNHEKLSKILQAIMFAVLAIAELAAAGYLFHLTHTVGITPFRFIFIAVFILLTVVSAQGMLDMIGALREMSRQDRGLNRHLVYLSHPYGGKEENLQNCLKIYRKYQPKLYRQSRTVLLPPLQICYPIYEDVPYEEGLALCMEFLQICDELWVCPGWENSKGCKREVEYATKHHMKIKYLSDNVAE